MFNKKHNKMEKKKIHPLTRKEKMAIQLWLGVGLAIAGVALLWVSFFVPPTGIIDPSVLTAIGEVFTFSGALIGIDYSYKFKELKLRSEEIKEDDEE